MPIRVNQILCCDHMMHTRFLEIKWDFINFHRKVINVGNFSESILILISVDRVQHCIVEWVNLVIVHLVRGTTMWSIQWHDTVPHRCVSRLEFIKQLCSYWVVVIWGHVVLNLTSKSAKLIKMIFDLIGQLAGGGILQISWSHIMSYIRI